MRYALTAISGIGRRFSNIICKKADIDMNKRAGELTPEEIDRLVAVIQNPVSTFKIPKFFLNRQKDTKTGKDEQVMLTGRHPFGTFACTVEDKAVFRQGTVRKRLAM